MRRNPTHGRADWRLRPNEKQSRGIRLVFNGESAALCRNLQETPGNAASIGHELPRWGTADRRIPRLAAWGNVLLQLKGLALAPSRSPATQPVRQLLGGHDHAKVAGRSPAVRPVGPAAEGRVYAPCRAPSPSFSGVLGGLPAPWPNVSDYLLDFSRVIPSRKPRGLTTNRAADEAFRTPSKALRSRGTACPSAVSSWPPIARKHSMNRL